MFGLNVIVAEICREAQRLESNEIEKLFKNKTYRVASSANRVTQSLSGAGVFELIKRDRPEWPTLNILTRLNLRFWGEGLIWMFINTPDNSECNKWNIAKIMIRVRTCQQRLNNWMDRKTISAKVFMKNLQIITSVLIEAMAGIFTIIC